MSKKIRILCALVICTGLAGYARQAAPLRLWRTTPLPHVRGRIDHFDMDLAGHRLFMSALGNDTLEVFDLDTARLVHTIRGLAEPQGVSYVPASNLIFVANGADGTCKIFGGHDYRLRKIVHLAADADDTRYDAARRQVWIGYGEDNRAGLAILDGGTRGLLATIALPGHPESFQLAASKPLIFVNIPTAANTVVVVNRNQRRIVATWTLGGAQDNFPMALDEADHRLFIVCRAPPEVLVLDTTTGKTIAHVPCVAHADDMWYDAARKRIYVSGGAGFISVIVQQDADHYRSLTQIRTAPGGRTSFFIPQLDRLYLGVWGRNGRPEELRVYRVLP